LATELRGFVVALVFVDGDALLRHLVVAVLHAPVGAPVEAAEAVVLAVDVRNACRKQ
jgi:hypothetical protein